MAGSFLGVMHQGTAIQRGSVRAPFFHVGGLIGAVALCSFLKLAALAMPAQAHVTENGLRQDIVVQELISSTKIWVRTPLPFIFSEEIDLAARKNAPLESDLLYVQQSGPGSRYRVNMTALAEAGARFESRLRRVLHVSRNDRDIAPAVTRWRLAPRWPNVPFNTPQAAQASLETPSAGLDPVFGEAVIEFELRLPAGTAPLQLKAGLPPLVLSETVDMDTYIVRFTLGEQRLNIVQIGQLDRTVTLPSAIWLNFARRALTGAGVVLPFLAILTAYLWRRRRKLL